MMWNGFGAGYGLLPLVVSIVVLVFPIARILGRLGFSQWWALVTLVPLVNLVFLWVLAFAEWPRDRAEA